ncbi:MAG TPA: hypothetical protein VK742_01110 [Candidatus Sulfotelmatobacter sp.]|jgi:hypothetical protein|nr:hypothetical protein [Candidatus Sulfotelmatobacter sp.]
MRNFGHQRPVRDEQKQVVEMYDSPVAAITRDELGGQFGRDKRRRVIFTLERNDLVAMRPAGTTRTLRVQARDIYRWALQCAALNFSRKVQEYKKTMTLKQARKRARKEFGL